MLPAIYPSASEKNIPTGFSISPLLVDTNTVLTEKIILRTKYTKKKLKPI